MTEVTAVIHEKHYTTYIQAGANSLTADEAVSNGGQGEGFNPEQLLTASLAACTSITTRMYADRKGYALEKIEVDITMSRSDDGTFTSLQRNITLYGALSADERARVLQIANNCPIHKILSNQITIKTELL